MTIHRPENTDYPEKLSEIVAAFEALPLPVLFPTHPRTRPKLEQFMERDGNVSLIDPVGYLDMLAMQCDSAAIVTDSGGVQEESCMVGTPCVTVRRSTERAITCEVGSNELVDAEMNAIAAALERALAKEPTWERPERWDAEVSKRIVEVLDGGLPKLRGA